MRAMSEDSQSPSGPARFRLFLRALRSPRSKEALGRLFLRGRRGGGPARASAVLESRAARAIRKHLDANATNLERAARLEEKAERLQRAGTPSESARNRAQRAREEVVSGFAALRASFVETAGGRAGAHAFDRVAKLLCPPCVQRRSSAGGAW
jgi:hypothetical protein